MRSSAWAATRGFLLVAAGTVVGIAGTDLVLPAVPSLGLRLDGTPQDAQFVLAAFAAGTGLGLLLFGELGARIDPRRALLASLAAYGGLSLAASLSPSLPMLILLRLLQGVASAAPAAFAPAFIRALFDEDHAISALGLLGSIEALTPALAPVFGLWLLAHGGWRQSFLILAVAAFALAAILLVAPKLLPAIEPVRAGSYWTLLKRRRFLRYALSQAFCLGGLLVIVFAAPAVFVESWGGTLTDFILLQVTGIAVFILAANLTGPLAQKIEPERLIVIGTLIDACGMLAILAYVVAGGRQPWLLVPPWLVVNLGFGLRGPPGFLRAIKAADGDDARGSALVVLFILLTASAGTAIAAPTVAHGFVGAAVVAASVSVASALCLLIPRR